MKEFWRILKLIFAWIIGSAGVIIGLMVIFESDTWIQRIFTGLFILISLYIIPKISNWLRLGIRPKIIAIAFLVSFLGMVFTDSIKPSSQTEISEVDSVEQYYVTASKLNVRKGSGTNHDVVYKLEKGDKVEIISQTNDWTEIKTTQGQGYVSSKYISTEKPESSETPEWLTYLIIGGIILYALFSKKGSSSSGGSSKPRSTPRPTSTPKPTTSSIKINNFQCKKCSTVIQSAKQPSAFNCSSGGHHSWTNLGEIGDTNFQCKKCGLLLQSNKRPSAFDCGQGGHHSWTDLGKVGADSYQCTKCGLLLKSKNRPSAFDCQSGGHHSWSKL